jgi:K+-sensing histidine kinase KdpD
MSIVFSQLFYEAAFHADKVSFKVEDEEQPLFDQFLASVFKEEETENLSQTLKSQIKSNHTSISRAARLCKFMKDSETKLKLEKMRGTL